MVQVWASSVFYGDDSPSPGRIVAQCPAGLVWFGALYNVKSESVMLKVSGVQSRFCHTSINFPLLKSMLLSVSHL